MVVAEAQGQYFGRIKKTAFQGWKAAQAMGKLVKRLLSRWLGLVADRKSGLAAHR